MSSSLIPIPVSFTTKEICAVFSCSYGSNTASKVISPSCVYLTALLRRFTRICLIRISSPLNTLGMFSSIITLKASSFALALKEIILVTSWIILEKAYSDGIIVSFPASIFVISKISFIMLKSDLAAPCTSIAYSFILCSLLSLRIISFIPSTALIGVLISCDILARKLVFA